MKSITLETTIGRILGQFADEIGVPKRVKEGNPFVEKYNNAHTRTVEKLVQLFHKAAIDLQEGK